MKRIEFGFQRCQISVGGLAEQVQLIAAVYFRKVSNGGAMQNVVATMALS